MAALTARLKILVALAVVVALAAGGFLALRHAPAPSAPPLAGSPAPAAAPQSECLLPGPAPVPPDGAIATAADIGLGHDTIQAFVNQLEAYQACLNNKVDHAPPGVTDKQKDGWIEQGNAAVDQANALAAAFSEQLKIFKARPKSK
jgi:hypothetical protein